jgi:hypothetical protein
MSNPGLGGQRSADWTSVILTSSYVNSDGTAATGWVTFEPSKTVVFGGNQVVAPIIVNAVLAANGALYQELPCTDDAQLSTTDWYYIVTEHVPNGRAPYKIQITAGDTLASGHQVPLRSLESITKVAL